MRLLKRIVEMIFIFLVPLMLLLFGLKINKVYDENNNLTSQYLSYENGIFRQYKDNLQYKNTFYINQKLRNILSGNNNYYIELDGNYNQFVDLTNGILQEVNHKYYVYVKMTSFDDNLGNIYFYPTSSPNVLVNITNNNNIYQNIVTVQNPSSIYSLQLRTYGAGSLYYHSKIDYQLIDLTVMFGSGYEPSTVNDLSNYLELFNLIDYTEQPIENVIYSNDILSSYYLLNYTWYNDILVSLSNHLQFNNNFMIQIIFIYIILIFVNLLLWYSLYVPFDMLFGLLLRKLEYYK